MTSTFPARFMIAFRSLLVMALAALAMSGPALAQTVHYDLATTSVMRINLPVSQAVTVTISGPVGKIVAADPSIAEAQPITDRSLYLVGRAFGTTTVNLFTDAGTPVGLLAVEVGADTADMQRSIRAALPASKVAVNSINGRIHLSGSVPDSLSMQKVLDIVGQYGSPAMVNTMTIDGGQQVNLEVRILEARRDATRELGVSWGSGSFSSFVTSIISGGLSLSATITAMENRSLVRTLAEPNLTTLSGINASFLAGGQVPIRTRAEEGDVALEYKDFGVRLNFTPVVLDHDRIQIQLAPEVSGIGGFTTGGDPVFNTRNLNATVELRDGQSFAIAGLLQNDTMLRQEQLPWIGDVPILGALFRSSSYQKQDTELVVIVTPRLVQPLTPGQIAATPLDRTQPANDFEFFALGKLEVTPRVLEAFETGSGIVGPYGYILDLSDGQ